NFDYRLVFLLLTLPQLVEWTCMPAHRLSSLAATTLVAIVVLLWVGSLSQWLNLWDELASWAVAGLLAAVIVATVPRLQSVRESAIRSFASAVASIAIFRTDTRRKRSRVASRCRSLSLGPHPPECRVGGVSRPRPVRGSRRVRASVEMGRCVAIGVGRRSSGE